MTRGAKTSSAIGNHDDDGDDDHDDHDRDGDDNHDHNDSQLDDLPQISPQLFHPWGLPLLLQPLA